jgi:hypothetical protein
MVIIVTKNGDAADGGCGCKWCGNFSRYNFCAVVTVPFSDA